MTWIEEFREFFDKALKPKKPTMENLERELCIDFIEKLITRKQQELVEQFSKDIVDRIDNSEGYWDALIEILKELKDKYGK